MWLAEKWPEMVIKCAELLTIVTTRLGETVFKIGEFIVDYLKKIAIFQGTAWSPYDELGHYYNTQVSQDEVHMLLVPCLAYRWRSRQELAALKTHAAPPLMYYVQLT